MNRYALLKDSINDSIFGVIVDSNGLSKFYGVSAKGLEWSKWANGINVKSENNGLPIGVVVGGYSALRNTNPNYVQALVDTVSLRNPSINKKQGISDSLIKNSSSVVPGVRDAELRAFDIDKRNEAIAFKARAFRTDSKVSSLLTQVRAERLGFVSAEGVFSSRNPIHTPEVKQAEIIDSYGRSLQRAIGLSLIRKKSVKMLAVVRKDQALAKSFGLEVKAAGIGPKIGSRLSGGLRAAPAGMSFVDITGVTDADTDGIVFEGKPGLERPIIPRFMVPKDLARKLSGIVEGDAEAIEKQRRAGNTSVQFDEGKLRNIIASVGGDANMLTALTGENGIPVTTPSGRERLSVSAPSPTGIARDVARDAVIGSRVRSGQRSDLGDATPLSSGELKKLSQQELVDRLIEDRNAGLNLEEAAKKYGLKGGRAEARRLEAREMSRRDGGMRSRSGGMRSRSTEQKRIDSNLRAMDAAVGGYARWDDDSWDNYRQVGRVLDGENLNQADRDSLSEAADKIASGELLEELKPNDRRQVVSDFRMASGMLHSRSDYDSSLSRNGWRKNGDKWNKGNWEVEVLVDENNRANRLVARNKEIGETLEQERGADVGALKHLNVFESILRGSDDRGFDDEFEYYEGSGINSFEDYLNRPELEFDKDFAEWRKDNPGKTKKDFIDDPDGAKEYFSLGMEAAEMNTDPESYFGTSGLRSRSGGMRSRSGNEPLTDEQVTNIKKRLTALESAVESGDKEAQKELLKKIFKGKSYLEPFIGEQFGIPVLYQRPKTLGRDGNSSDAPDKEITDEDLAHFIKNKYEDDVYNQIWGALLHNGDDVDDEEGLSSEQIEEALPYIDLYDTAMEILEEENEGSYDTPSTIEEIADIVGSEELLSLELWKQINLRKEKLKRNEERGMRSRTGGGKWDGERPEPKDIKPGADLSGANLSGMDLRDVDLQGADLAGADLSEANLMRANLRNAYLANANLRLAVLDEADLSFAKLNRSILINAQLSNAQMGSADLSFADLRAANFSDANLAEADLTNANLSYAFLADADMSGATLHNANLYSANLNDTNLQGAFLRGANMDKGWEQQVGMRSRSGGMRSNYENPDNQIHMTSRELNAVDDRLSNVLESGRGGFNAEEENALNDFKDSIDNAGAAMDSIVLDDDVRDTLIELFGNIANNGDDPNGDAKNLLGLLESVRDADGNEFVTDELDRLGTMHDMNFDYSAMRAPGGVRRAMRRAMANRRGRNDRDNISRSGISEMNTSGAPKEYADALEKWSGHFGETPTRRNRKTGKVTDSEPNHPALPSIYWNKENESWVLSFGYEPTELSIYSDDPRDAANVVSDILETTADRYRWENEDNFRDISDLADIGDMYNDGDGKDGTVKVTAGMRSRSGMRSRTEPLFEAERLDSYLSDHQQSRLYEAAFKNPRINPKDLDDGNIPDDHLIELTGMNFYNPEVNDDLADDIEDLMVERDNKRLDAEGRSSGIAKDNARSVIKHWQDSVDDDPDKMGDLLSSYEGDLVAAMEDHYDDYLNGQLDTFENRRDGGMRSRSGGDDSDEGIQDDYVNSDRYWQDYEDWMRASPQPRTVNEWERQGMPSRSGGMRSSTELRGRDFKRDANIRANHLGKDAETWPRTARLQDVIYPERPYWGAEDVRRSDKIILSSPSENGGPEGKVYIAEFDDETGTLTVSWGRADSRNLQTKVYSGKTEEDFHKLLRGKEQRGYRLEGGHIPAKYSSYDKDVDWKADHEKQAKMGMRSSTATEKRPYTNVPVTGSSALRQASYNAEKEELVVTYANGKTYTYKNFSNDDLDNALSGPDYVLTGTVVNQIKKNHDFREGGVHTFDPQYQDVQGPGGEFSVGKLSRLGRGEKTQIPVSGSSAIEALTWDDENEDLIVTYAGGRTYTYKDVDSYWIEDLERETGTGRIINNIKKEGYRVVDGGEHGDMPSEGLTAERAEFGMRSRMAPSSGRIRAAEMEISARPQGMASRRSEGLRDARFAVPGRDRVDPSDGELWGRLSDEEKATVADRAVNREKMLLNEFKQRFPRWWDRASKEADKKGWDKDLMNGGNAGWMDELHRFVTRLADDPDYPEKNRVEAEKQFNDLQALYNMRSNRGSHDLLEHLNPTSRRYLFDDARRDDSKKTRISASGKEMKTPSTAPRPLGDPIDTGTPIREQVGQNEKKPLKARLDAYYKRMSDKILYTDPARQARREMRKARRQGINAGGFTTSEANPVDDAKRKIRRRKRLKEMRKNRTRDIGSISDSSTGNRIDGRLAHTDSQGSLVFGDKLTSTLATMMKNYRTESKLKKTKGGVSRNRALAVLWDGAGYNGTPHVVTAEEFKALHAAGWLPVVRGHGSGANGVRYANDWIDDPVRFITGQGGEAQGEGEYWARPTQGGGGWFSWMDGSLPAGTVGLLPPSTRRVSKAELGKIKSEHAPLAKSIKAFDAGLPSGEREKMDAEEYVTQLRDHLRSSLGPIYESTMSTKMGQMTSKILESLSGSSDSKKQELLDALEFLELISTKRTSNSYAPLLGYDTIMADSGVELIHNRTAITIVGDTLTRDDAVKLAKSKA